MRKAMFIVWALWGATLAVGAAEREVLRVEYEYFQAGEQSSFWTERFFVGVDGVLSSAVKTFQADAKANSPTSDRTVFRWQGPTLEWESALDSGSIVGAEGNYVVRHRGVSESVVVSQTEHQFSWRSLSTRGTWSLENGYDRRLLSDPETGPPQFEGITTNGSRVTLWVYGAELYRILFNRTPKRLEGRIFAPAENAPGLYECGRIAFEGQGLWTDSSDVRTKIFLYLERQGWLQGWHPFVLTPDFLH